MIFESQTYVGFMQLYLTNKLVKQTVWFHFTEYVKHTVNYSQTKMFDSSFHKPSTFNDIPDIRLLPNVFL